jgi:UDP-N-acetyl-D-mannosaminuronic acid dehydrogenase
MYNLTVRALERLNKKPIQAKVAILGWAFINDSDDARNTPSETYRDLLLKDGARVEVHDPHVLEYPGVPISHDLSSVLKGADAVAIFAGHKEYMALDAAEVKRLIGAARAAVLDGRNVVDPDAFISEGFVYKGIGRGDKNDHPLA